MHTPQPPQNLESIQKTTRILEGLKELKGAGVTELADHLEMPKTTVHAHLTTLNSCELVTKENQKYRLGFRLVEFGEFAKNQFNLYNLAKDEIDMLAEESQDMAQFMVEEHGLGVYLYKAEPPRAVRTTADIGDRRLLHCTGLGKAILSRLPEERVHKIIEHRGLPAKTEKTITDREELLSELQSIREQGYAVDNEEIQSGLRCVAAPVEFEEQGIVGAVSVSGPIGRIEGERFEKDLPEMVTNAANVIEINARNM